jgi:hypothetical protein
MPANSNQMTVRLDGAYEVIAIDSGAPIPPSADVTLLSGTGRGTSAELGAGLS